MAKNVNRKSPEAHRRASAKYTRKTRMAVLELLGGKCVNCGFSDVRALQIDHINGGGTKETAGMRGAGYWKVVMRSFLDNEKKYQLLCANCNWIKRYEKQEHKGRPRNV